MQLSMKAATSRAGACRFAGRKVSSASNGSRVMMKAGNWLPGSETPSWLAEDIPGNYGFDPVGLGRDSETLMRFREAELIHCRWAMLGVAGCLAVEVLGYGNWYDAPNWALTGGEPTWFGVPVPFDIPTLLGVEVLSFAIVEGLRNENQDGPRRLYPGGAFDPLGFSKDAKAFETNKLKEIKNGRLAMVAMLGFISQHSATGKGPVAALSEHLSNPWGANFATNGVSVPFV
ncbi:light-harvesting protein of photosystem I [Haematococcus lacustris]|nr:hypothetical protein QJQ45_019741 [Haematococcus lacustris]